MSFNFFTFSRTLCLSLERKNLQTTVRGFDLFFWNLTMQWQRSISISSVISNLFLIIFLTSSSQFPQVSFGVSGMPSIRTLFREDLCSNSVNFSITKMGSKRSSISLRSVWFFTFAKPSWSSSWVNSRLLVFSTTSCEILSRRSFVFVSWDLIISLTLSWWSSNSSLRLLSRVSLHCFLRLLGLLV